MVACWLVASTPLKNMNVNWDNDIPNLWKNKSNVPNHQPASSNTLTRGIFPTETNQLPSSASPAPLPPHRARSLTRSPSDPHRCGTRRTTDDGRRKGTGAVDSLVELVLVAKNWNTWWIQALKTRGLTGLKSFLTSEKLEVDERASEIILPSQIKDL